MPRPRVRDYEELRRDLVDAAGHLLADEGPEALSTRRVAEQVAVSTTAVYSVFGDKAGLVRAMFLAGFERLEQAFAAVPRTADPAADLLALAAAYRANALANPHLYELMFGRPVPQFVPDDEALQRIQGTYDALVAAVGRCVAADAVAAADPEDTAIGLNALVHGLTSLELRGALGPPEEADRHWRSALATTLRGLQSSTAVTSSSTRTSGSKR